MSDILPWFVCQLAQEHRVILLQCMEKIVKDTLDQIDTGLATDLIKLGALEMTLSKVSTHTSLSKLNKILLMYL